MGKETSLIQRSSQKGQEVDSMILDIDLSKKKRLSLGLKQLLPNPWDNLSSELELEILSKEKITGITKYGAFVEVETESKVSFTLEILPGMKK